jgi:hypothetical protein
MPRRSGLLFLKNRASDAGLARIFTRLAAASSVEQENLGGRNEIADFDRITPIHSLRREHGQNGGSLMNHRSERAEFRVPVRPLPGQESLGLWCRHETAEAVKGIASPISFMVAISGWECGFFGAWSSRPANSRANPCPAPASD